MKNKICCIYHIVNIVNGKYYIGSTEDFDKRVKRHNKDLKLKRHHNIYLQRAYDKYGIDKFKFVIVERCYPSQRVQKEQSYLNKMPDFTKCYNVSGAASGGDLIKNHPDKERIIKEKTDILIAMNKDPNRKRPDTNGRNNPNYGNKWNKEQRKYASKLVKKRWEELPESEKIKQSERSKKQMKELYSSPEGIRLKEKYSKDRKGSKNAFYGKKHTKKTKNKIGKANKGRLPPSECSVTIEGVDYLSIPRAAKILKIPMETVWYRIKSTNPRFINWNKTGQQKEVSNPNYGENMKRSLMAEGIFYTSISDAAKFYNKSVTAIIFRTNSSDPKWKEFYWEENPLTT